MKTQYRHREKGFTLVELTMSVVASGVLMLVTMNLMGYGHRQWSQANDVRKLTTELAMTLENIAVEVKTTRVESVSVSAANDTLKIGAGIRFFVDASNNMVVQRNGNNFEMLEGMVTQFTVETPVVRAPGDTLQTVAVTLVAEYEAAHDSTSVWLTPRL